MISMHFFADGGCRDNGRPTARGAAACFQMKGDGSRVGPYTYLLPPQPTPTNQRAELMAIVMALQAMVLHPEFTTMPSIECTIHTDSRYAVHCMNTWIHKWRLNGWLNARGLPVANRDVIEKAADLDAEFRQRNMGTVEYTWIPRASNKLADMYVNQALDAADTVDESQVCACCGGISDVLGASPP